MKSTHSSRLLRIAVTATALSLSAWSAQAVVLTAQGAGCGVPSEGGPVGKDTIIKLPGSDGILCPGAVTGKRQEFLDGLSTYTTEEFASTGKSKDDKGFSILSGMGTIDTNTGGGLRFFENELDTINGRWDTTTENQTPGGLPGGGWFMNGDLTKYIEVLLTFQTPQDAVGFYITDYPDFGASAEVELFNGNSSVGKYAITGTSLVDATVSFFGVYSDQAFTKFRINFAQPTSCIPGDEGCDNVGIDSLVVGIQDRDTPVPEPGSLALVGLALIAARRIATRRPR